MSDAELETRIARGLCTAVPVRAGARQAIMEQIRAIPAAERPRRSIALYGRAMRQSLIGLAFAAGIGSITTLSAFAPAPESAPHGTRMLASAVIGDTVVGRLRDTLRLVKLMFNDSTAHRIAVVGEFNGWSERGTDMRRDGRTGTWTTVVALPDGDHRYAVVVDNTRWVGRLHVARTTN